MPVGTGVAWKLLEEAVLVKTNLENFENPEFRLFESLLRRGCIGIQSSVKRFFPKEVFREIF